MCRPPLARIFPWPVRNRCIPFTECDMDLGQEFSPLLSTTTREMFFFHARTSTKRASFFCYFPRDMCVALSLSLRSLPKGADHCGGWPRNRTEKTSLLKMQRKNECLCYLRKSKASSGYARGETFFSLPPAGFSPWEEK